MTDQPELEPGQRLPARREPSEPVPADRFSAPPSAHARDLSPERAASIVRQSASARWVAFLAVCVVALFTIAYYFYEVGLPLGLSTPRLADEANSQQVTAIQRGYNLYQANCARCHGPNGKGTGEGYIAPPLNDPMKLFDHLNAVYLKNVLTVGGRYVCGNASSVMPIWADTNGGPLNYNQIEDLIAFIRSDATQQYIERDPSLNEPVIGKDGKVQTFKGWVDPSFKPDPASSPVPACWSGSAGAGGTPAPAESLPAGSDVLKLTAEGITYDVKELTATAGKSFGIDFTQKDPAGFGGHNVEIRDQSGKTLFDGEVLLDPGETTYVVPALPAGTYTFICRIHPIPAMTGTLTIK